MFGDDAGPRPIVYWNRNALDRFRSKTPAQVAGETFLAESRGRLSVRIKKMDERARRKNFFAATQLFEPPCVK
jgi:hypothetical protein